MGAARRSVFACFQGHLPKALLLAPRTLSARGGVSGRACSTHISHRVFRWLQEQKMAGSTIRIKMLAKRGKTSSSLEREPKQGLQRAISFTSSSQLSQSHPFLMPLPGPGQGVSPDPTRATGPRHPARASPPSFHWRPKAGPLLRYPPRRETGRRRGKAWGRDGALTLQPPTPLHPESRGRGSCLTDTSLLATKNQIRMMFSHSSRSSRPPEAPGTSARPLTPVVPASLSP